MYKAPESNWLNNKDFFSIPRRELTEEEKADCILYALLSPNNNCATYRFADGSIITNYLNPLDNTLFDFSQSSAIAKKALDEARNYLLNVVRYDRINTLFGKGTFLGFYQYKTIKDSKHDQCFGFKYSKEFDDAIEDLRNKISKLAEEVCL